SFGDAHQQLAEILALEETEECARRLLQSVDDVLAILDASCTHPFADVAQEVALLGGKVRYDEAAQQEALAQHREHVGTGHRGGGAGLREEAADRNAGEVVGQRPHRVLHGTADILEIDVDAVRTGGFEPPRKMRLAMVDASVEAKLVDDEAAL